MAADSETRALVAKSCRILGGLGLTKAATGHVSALSPDGKYVLIRARGRDERGVRYTTAEQIIAADFDGNKIDGPDGLETPQEIFIHTALYKARPEVRCVTHIHPMTVVLFTICNKPIEPIYGAYDPSSLDMILDGIPTYQRSITITNDELGQDLVKAMDGKRVCLMRGHGITTVGHSVEEATLHAIRLNEAAEMNYRAALLGGAQRISDEDIAHFRRKREKSQAGGKNPDAVWRYYAELAGA
jgi:L-fuculose-phosphate aldolase